MNWYKRSQHEWKWDRFFKGLGAGVILGLAAWLGLSQMELKEKYIQDPNAIEQKVTEYQQQDNQIVEEQNPFEVNFQDEYQVIMEAAKRNDLAEEDYSILFAIRKAENGGKGREFGIIHPRCDEQMKKNPEKTLDIQAGWAASTIRKNRERWKNEGRPGDFITYLGNKYAPRGVSNDPNDLNENWISNVSNWVNKLR